MNEIKINVSFEKRTLSMEGVSLVSGDYNSTKLSFIFDKEYEGRKVFELAKPDTDEAVFVKEIENNEIILVAYDENGNEASIFSEVGKYPFEISLYGEDSKLTSMNGKLRVSKEMVKIGDKVVEVYLPIFDKLMQDVSTSINELKAAENAIQEAETARKEEEESRILAEKSRAEAEKNRVTAETKRAENETARANAEKSRAEAETKRVEEEKKRDTAEKTRSENETTRQTNETAREEAETTRNTNESTRIANEIIRQEKFRMIDNTLKSMTVEGSNIHVSDSADWFAKVGVFGKSEQETNETMPSFEFPSPVKSVTGDIEVEVCNKNFLDLQKYPLSTSNSIYNGGTINIVDGNLIVDATNATGAVTARSSSRSMAEGRTKLKAGTYYFHVATNGCYESDTTKNVQINRGLRTLTEDYYISQWYLGVSAGTKVEQIAQIEKDTETTDYTPHQSQTYPLHINKELNGDETVRDRIVKRNGKWCYEFNWGKLILDGTNYDFSIRSDISNNNTYHYRLTSTGTVYDNMKSQTEVYCNYLKCENSANDYEHIRYVGTTDGYKIQLVLDKTIYPTVDVLKTKLQELYNEGTPLYVVYQLAEPIYEETTDETLISQLDAIEEKAKTYKTVTNISSDAHLEVVYKKDLQTQVDTVLGDIETVLGGV